MAAKQFNVEGFGEVCICKRHRTKRISLKVIGHKVQVTQPTWLPYSSGLQFAIKNRIWVDKQKAAHPQFLPEDNEAVGKFHTLVFSSGPTLRSKIANDQITINIPPHLHHRSPKVLALTKVAIKKALKDEAQRVIPGRLNAFAAQYGLKYSGLNYKSMRTRWGSCNNRGDITINISLLLLPYELIDYVLLHELMHTKHLNHSSSFWADLALIMPDYKQRRQALKALQHQILPLH